VRIRAIRFGWDGLAIVTPTNLDKKNQTRLKKVSLKQAASSDSRKAHKITI
jgi:hypothetical protein